MTDPITKIMMETGKSFPEAVEEHGRRLVDSRLARLTAAA